MTASLGFGAIKQSDDFRAILDLSTTAVSDQELDKPIHAGQICRVVDFTLMARRSQDSRAFERGKMA